MDGGRRAPADVRQRYLDAHPWLDADDLAALAETTERRVCPRVGRHPRDAAVAEGDAEPDGGDTESDHSSLHIGEEVVDVAAELAELRAGIRPSAGAYDWFCVQVRGGHWTAERFGVPADSIAGRARGGLANTWCDMYGFQKGKYFKVSQYARDGGFELAREYCRRASFFFK